MSEYNDSPWQRYIKLAILVIVAGNIYPLIYLRQNFEVSLLDSLNITAQQLEQNYAMLGILYMVTYLPSGWLADRVSPRVLMSFSLAATGVLGAWFATLPSFWATQIIFAGWGIAAGLTFWAALIKATTLLALPSEQGRFFGILESGRGLVEAILATCAVALFAYATRAGEADTAAAMQSVIWMYVTAMLILAPISFFALKSQSNHSAKERNQTAALIKKSSLVNDLAILFKKPELWLCSICILTGYQLYWATYSFSAYMQNHYGLTAVAVGSITVASQWMRPIGAVAAGFFADFLTREKVLASLLVVNSLALLLLTFLPAGSGATVLLGTLLCIGLVTYAIRGIYWSTLESCDISNHVKGLAIGIISFVGYAPHAYLPLLRASLIETYSERTGFTIYYSILAFMGFLGAIAAWMLMKRSASFQVNRNK